ncbi:polysaccharide deacetylase family protein [Henriciella marina]|uniref:polysaccharide deacetylase family protein n=1 Tax=Henriciella marina TaxID=453851 RepID=UPI00037CBC29|nr:polysaccharide deacetylase family protein [Henriciella marina]
MTAAALSAYQPSDSLLAKFRRRAARWHTARPLDAAPKRTRICFTFDDFPKSAADTGAEILDEVGAKGCYYACTGMAGTENHLGKLFDERDLKALTAAGHEIGAHTQTHLDCSQAPASIVLSDIDANLRNLVAMGHDAIVRQFAWPYGETRRDLKPRLATRFDAVRGIHAGVNRERADLMQLTALELDANESSVERAAAAIENAAGEPAWIFVFTHDVRDNHSKWGTTPAHFRRLVRLARDTGAVLETPSAALDAIMVKERA